MVTTVGGVAIEIRGDDSHFERTMREVRQEAGRTGQVMGRSFKTAGNEAAVLNTKIKGAATSMLALTAALGAGAGLAQGIRTISDFSQAMSTVQAVTGATTEQMKLLTEEAKRLGGTTRFSATQAAEGMIFLARAGFTANEAMQALEGTLTLAQAGGLDLGRAADIASNVLGGFNLNVDQTARVVDVLAKAANSANVTVESLGEALKFAAPTSAALGLSLEETVAVIGKLGDSGLQGGLGGRGFQSFATSFVGKANEITEIIGPFNLAEEGLNNLIKRLVEAGITTEQVINIFRAENLDVFTILANASQDAAKGTETLTNKLNNAGGTAANVAKTMDDNLNGAILGALSAFESLILAIGEAGATAALTNTFKGLADLLRLAAANADVLGVAFVAMTARAIIPLATSAVPAAIGALRNLAGSLLFVQGAAARTALTMSALGGPLTLAIAGAAAAYLVLARNAETAQQRLDRANAALDQSRAVLLETQGILSGSNSPLQQIADQAGDAVGQVDALAGALGDLVTGMKNLREEGQIATALKLGEALAATDASIQELEAQRARAGGRAFNQLNLGGQAGLQRNIDRELARFDDSEEGQALLRLRQERAALQNRLRVATEGLNAGDLINQFRNGSPGSGAAESPATIAGQAAATGDLADEAERAAEAQADLVALLDDADEFFQGRRDALSRQRFDEFNLNRAERDRNEQEAQAAAEALKDRFSQSIARGLEEGIRSGNWGDALEGILQESLSNALSNAINELADALVDILGGVFDGLGQGIGLGLGGLFGGGRAAGGNVRAGMRYMVGEQGPEMFVPTVPGVILPKSEFPASAAMGGVGGGGLVVNAPFIIQGSVTEEVLPRVQAMMAAQAKELPRIVDARVSDSLRRGRY